MLRTTTISTGRVVVDHIARTSPAAAAPAAAARADFGSTVVDTLRVSVSPAAAKPHVGIARCCCERCENKFATMPLPLPFLGHSLGPFAGANAFLGGGDGIEGRGGGVGGGGFGGQGLLGEGLGGGGVEGSGELGEGGALLFFSTSSSSSLVAAEIEIKLELAVVLAFGVGPFEVVTSTSTSTTTPSQLTAE